MEIRYNSYNKTTPPQSGQLIFEICLMWGHFVAIYFFWISMISFFNPINTYPLELLYPLQWKEKDESFPSIHLSLFFTSLGPLFKHKVSMTLDH